MGKYSSWYHNVVIDNDSEFGALENFHSHFQSVYDHNDNHRLEERYMEKYNDPEH